MGRLFWIIWVALNAITYIFMKRYSTHTGEQEAMWPGRLRLDPCGHKLGNSTATRSWKRQELIIPGASRGSGLLTSWCWSSETDFTLLSGFQKGEKINFRFFQATKFMTLYYNSNRKLKHKPLTPIYVMRVKPSLALWILRAQRDSPSC